MLTVEVAINGSPAWLVTASRDEAPPAEGPVTYRVAAYDAAGLETMRMAGEEPRPLVSTTVEHDRSDGALALAASVARAAAELANSGDHDERLVERLTSG